MQSIYSNSSLQDNDKLEAIAKRMFEMSSNPPPPEPDLGGIARVQSVEQRERDSQRKFAIANRKLDQEADDNFADRRLEAAKAASE